MVSTPLVLRSSTSRFGDWMNAPVLPLKWLVALSSRYESAVMRLSAKSSEASARISMRPGMFVTSL